MHRSSEIGFKHERCLEKQRRLGLEAGNMCHWYGKPDNRVVAVQSYLQNVGELSLHIPSKIDISSSKLVLAVQSAHPSLFRIIYNASQSWIPYPQSVSLLHLHPSV